MTLKNLLPPKADRRPRVEIWHGHEKRDDYHWLKAENWQEVMHDPALLPADIRAFLEAENAYHEAALADTQALQDTLFAEMKGRIKEDDSSVPTPWLRRLKVSLATTAMPISLQPAAAARDGQTEHRHACCGGDRLVEHDGRPQGLCVSVCRSIGAATGCESAWYPTTSRGGRDRWARQSPGTPRANHVAPHRGPTTGGKAEYLQYRGVTHGGDRSVTHTLTNVTSYKEYESEERRI